MANKKTIFVIGTIGLLTYLLVPRIAALLYRSNTNPAEIEEKRKEYNELASLKDLSIAKSNLVRKRKNEIYLWMHARDIQIDEGHEDLSLLQEWDELIDYWKSEDK